MNRIAFRVDGGKKIGMGHIMRSLVLANELSKKNNIMFISIKNDKDDFRAGIKKVESEGFNVIEINEEDIVNQLARIQEKYNFHCLITDSYEVNREYFDNVKKIFNKTGYIDDINICEFNIDFLINQNIDADNHKYKFYGVNKSKVFLGTKYCLLRDEFRGESTNKCVENYQDNVLITLGGMDTDHNTLKIIKELKDLKLNFHIVVGNAFETELILKLKELRENNDNIFLHENAIMSELMKKSGLAISASGSTLYELCAMQVPTIGLIVAENQKNVCRAMTEKGIIIGLDNDIEEAIRKVRDIVIDLSNNKEKILKLKSNQKSLVSIDGVVNVANEINNILCDI